MIDSSGSVWYCPFHKMFQSHSRTQGGGMSERRPTDAEDGYEASGKPVVIDELATQTLDLADLFTRDITASGSFDIRGGIWATTFGKLLQAVPIPGMLVDQAHKVCVVNQACGRISPSYESIPGTRLSLLATSPSNSDKLESILEEAFSTRHPKVVSAPLRIGDDADFIWCRMTFRPVRIIRDRFLLLLLEDLTSEKKRLAESKRYEEQLKRAHEDLEKRVQERTAELFQANVELSREIEERHKAENALREVVTTIEAQLRDLKEDIVFSVRANCQPLIDQLQAETNSESGKYLLRALEHHLTRALAYAGITPSKKLSILTPREIRICNLIISGLTSKEIAIVTGVTVDAVSSARYQIRKKLGLDVTGDSLAMWLRLLYDL